MLKRNLQVVLSSDRLDALLREISLHDVLRGKVLKRLASHQYVVSLKGQKIIANANSFLRVGSFFTVMVKKLRPTVELQFLSDKKEMTLLKDQVLKLTSELEGTENSLYLFEPSLTQLLDQVREELVKLSDMNDTEIRRAVELTQDFISEIPFPIQIQGRHPSYLQCQAYINKRRKGSLQKLDEILVVWDQLAEEKVAELWDFFELKEWLYLVYSHFFFYQNLSVNYQALEVPVIYEDGRMIGIQVYYRQTEDSIYKGRIFDLEGVGSTYFEFLVKTKECFFPKTSETYLKETFVWSRILESNNLSFSFLEKLNDRGQFAFPEVIQKVTVPNHLQLDLVI